MKYIFYHNNNYVKFFSKGTKVSDSSLSYKIIDLSTEEISKLLENWDLSISEDKLIFTEAAHMKKQRQEDMVALIKEKANKITTLAGAKETINQILEFIK